MADELEREEEVHIWDRDPEEPEEDYKKFSEYYLPMGFRRTIRGAFAASIIDGNKEGAARLGKADAGKKWYQLAQEWSWEARARAYDEYMVADAVTAVKQAQLDLRLATVDAVEALKKNLVNPRLAVSAAKEILDRGGIPGRTISDVTNTVHINSDDMAAATKEIDEWEKTILGESGSNVVNP